MPNIKIQYFDIKGLAESSRLALSAAGVPFEDIRIKFEDWPAKKESTPFGQMPIMWIDDKMITQSGAMLRYAGKMTGLYPRDDMEAMRVDEMLGIVADCKMKLAASMYEKDPERKLAMRKTFTDEQFPTWATKLEAYLKTTGAGQFLAGNTMSVADLELLVYRDWIASGMVDDVPKDIFSKYTVLSNICTATENSDPVKNYYAARK